MKRKQTGKPEVFAIRKGTSGWELSRRSLFSAAAAAAAAPHRASAGVCAQRGATSRVNCIAIRAFVDRLNNRDDAEEVVPAQPQGQETGATRARCAVFGKTRDRGGEHAAGGGLGWRAELRSDGVGANDRGAGMVGAPPAQKPFGGRAQPLSTRPIEKNDRQVIVQDVDWLFR